MPDMEEECAFLFLISDLYLDLRLSFRVVLRIALLKFLRCIRTTFQK